MAFAVSGYARATTPMSRSSRSRTELPGTHDVDFRHAVTKAELQLIIEDVIGIDRHERTETRPYDGSFQTFTAHEANGRLRTASD